MSIGVQVVSFLALAGLMLAAWLNLRKGSTPAGLSAAELELVVERVVTRLNSEQSKDTRELHEATAETLHKNLGEFTSKLERTVLEDLARLKELQLESKRANQDAMRTSTEESKTALADVRRQNEASLRTLQESVQTKLDTLMRSLREQNTEELAKLRGEIDKRLDESFAKHLESFAQVKENLGQMQSTASAMIESTKSVDKLNAVFAATSAKATGQFAEEYLETMLKEQLNPRHWQAEVPVPGSGDRLDFVITLGAGHAGVESKKIGLDAKFPLTTYQHYATSTGPEQERRKKEFLRGVKSMAKDLNRKYLKPGFVDTLFMFLPSDSMYNEVVNDQATHKALQDLRVTPVSPTTLFPLILIVKNYEVKMTINENAQSIMDGLGRVAKNMTSFQAEYTNLGNKLRLAQQNYDKAGKSFTGMLDTVQALHRPEETTRLEASES